VIDRDLRRALGFVVPYWRRLTLVLVLSLVSTGVSLYLPLLTRDFFDQTLIGRDVSSLWRLAALFTATTAATFALNMISGLRYTRVSADILFDMRLQMYQHLQRLSPVFFARTRLGEILSRINHDLGDIQQIAAEAALAWVGNGLFLVGTVFMLAWLDVRLFVITVAIAPLSIIAAAHYRRRLEGHVETLRQQSADIGSFLVETLQANRLVVTSNAQAREAARFSDRNTGFVRALMSMQLFTYLAGGFPGLILSAGTGAVFIYGGWRVIEGTLTAGTFVAFTAYSMRFLPTLEGLLGLYSSLANVRVSLRRVSEILDAPVDVVESSNPLALGPVRGAVAFEDVTLSFDRGVPAIANVTFTVEPGEVLAIVGPSGSGKSTIADLLVRLLDPDSGTVRIDGHDIRTLRLADLRRVVAVVDQEPCLLHATIADNIRYARPDATDAAVVAASTAAALHPFVTRLPAGYQTVVGERGAALSAGERQRIATARAFLIDPSVLILDEPTASLDPVAEREVIAGYRRIMHGRTTIVITHRLDVARRADRVIVLDGARIVDAGTPDVLGARAGRFAELFNVEYAG
jgi:ATP-binding cassette, subfamily B, bacterial